MKWKKRGKGLEKFIKDQYFGKQTGFLQFHFGTNARGQAHLYV